MVDDLPSCWRCDMCCPRIEYTIESKVADPVGSGVLPGSGFQISLDPDPVSVQILEQKKIAESSLKLSEEHLKFMIKDRQKTKKATISY